MFSHQSYWDCIWVALLPVSNLLFLSQPFTLLPKTASWNRANFVTLLLQNDRTSCWQNAAQSIFFPTYLFSLYLTHPQSLIFSSHGWADMSLPCTLLLWAPLCPRSLPGINAIHSPFFQPIPINPFEAHLRHHFLRETFFDLHLLLEQPLLHPHSSGMLFLYTSIPLFLHYNVNNLRSDTISFAHFLHPIRCEQTNAHIVSAR